MKPITPCLWFDFNGEEAATFYTSLLPDSEIMKIVRYGKDGPAPEGTAVTVSFTLEGQPFVALNGGPQFPHSEAVSFIIYCDTQDEIDRLWAALTSNGGQESQCGWLRDRFGVSWQILPTVLDTMMNDTDPEKVSRVTQAFLPMKKMDIATLQAAYDGD